jgi:hypothetical protein
MGRRDRWKHGDSLLRMISDWLFIRARSLLLAYSGLIKRCKYLLEGCICGKLVPVENLALIYHALPIVLNIPAPKPIKKH